MSHSILRIQQISHPFGDVGEDVPVILVLGLGESGVAMAKWALSQGATVRVHDTRSEEQLNQGALNNSATLKEIGASVTHGQEIPQTAIEGVNIVAVSPGMSPLSSPIKELIANAEGNYKVWGELEFFSQALNALKESKNYSPKVLAITGTNGKTTTTALTGAICQRAGKHVAVAGNISPSLLDKLMECLSDSNKDSNLPEIWVLELSSFQLFYSETFNPTAATVLNITQDHFDWHGDFEHYCQSKARIFGENTVAILNRDDSRVMNLLLADKFERNRVVSFGLDAPLEEDSFGIVGDMGLGGFDWLAWAEPPIDEESLGIKKHRKNKNAAQEDAEPLRIKNLIPADALLIKGRHNAANALAALALANAAGLGMGMLLHGLRAYRGEPHRVQSIAIVNDVEYIDDSKGTNVGATIAALQGLGAANGGSTRKKIILIAGGDGKGQDFSPLAGPVGQYAKTVILIGRDASRIEEALSEASVEIIKVDDLVIAVNEASNRAVSGDMVLLSPACASFDMFKDYAHRAQVFHDAVDELSMQFQMTGAGV